MGNGSPQGRRGSRTRRVEPQGQWRLYLELLVAILLGILAGLASIGFVVEAAGAYPREHGGSRGGEIAGAIISIGVGYLAGRWAVHIEHRLRRGQPVADHYEAAHMTPRGRVRAPGFGRRGRGYSPVAATIVLILFAGVAVGCIFGAVSAHSQAVRSSYVQHHGVPSTGTILDVVNTQHCSRGGCNYTSAIAMDLSPPVDDFPVTTAHYPGFANLIEGQKVSVLVDPKRPSYAELPGSRFESSSSWIVLIVIAVLFGGLSILEGLALRRIRRIARRVRTQAAAGSAAAGG